MNLPKPVVILLAIFLLLVLPINLLLEAFFGFYPSMLQLLIGFFNIGSILVVLFFCAYWEYLSYYLRYLYLGLFLAAVLITIPQVGDLPWLPEKGWTGIGSQGSTLGIAILLLASTMMGLFPKGAVLSLAFPFRGGRFLVVEGGDGKWCFLLNYHYWYRRHRRSQSNRSMRYATDIIKIDALGKTNRGILPEDLEQYYIYGEIVYSPCPGRVVWVENDKPENAAYSGKYPYGIGNGVVIQRGDHYIILGHFHAGTIAVKVGDWVEEGQILGKIGNSGFSHRPHLHMQVSHSPDGDYWEGQGVPINFDGRFPYKNRVLSA